MEKTMTQAEFNAKVNADIQYYMSLAVDKEEKGTLPTPKEEARVLLNLFIKSIEEQHESN
jgi:hypothetical protein